MVYTFRKYRQFFLAHWQEALMYRAESLLWIFMDAVPLFAMVVLWIGVYRFGGNLLHLPLSGLLTYYFIGFFLSRFTDTHFEESGINQILDGSIAKYFLKPISLFFTLITGEVAWKILSTLLSLGPLMILISVFFRAWLLPLSLAQILLLCLFIILGFLLDSLIGFMIMAAAFYTDQGRSLSHAKWIILSMFNGSLLPIEAYPGWLKAISQFLPFRCLFAIPSQVYQGVIPPSKAVSYLLGEAIWVIVFSLLTALLWHQAKLKFTAVGS